MRCWSAQIHVRRTEPGRPREAAMNNERSTRGGNLGGAIRPPGAVHEYMISITVDLAGYVIFAVDQCGIAGSKNRRRHIHQLLGYAIYPHCGWPHPGADMPHHDMLFALPIYAWPNPGDADPTLQNAWLSAVRRKCLVARVLDRASRSPSRRKEFV